MRLNCRGNDALLTPISPLRRQPTSDQMYQHGCGPHKQPQQMMYRQGREVQISSHDHEEDAALAPGRLTSGGIGRHSSSGLPRAPMMGSKDPSEQWAPRSDRACTAADHASVANAREHNASLVCEIVFPRPGALGLNLRSFLVQEPAGARHGLPPYGTLKILDTQYIYLKTVVEPGDSLIAVNGQTLTGTKFNFEDAIALCSTASLPRVLRFARMEGAASAEIECALAADVCAVFDAVDTPEKYLVTAQLHPSAPPFFYLNSPTRQPRKTSPSSAMTSTATAIASNTTEAFASFPFPPAAVTASAAIPSPC